MGLRSCAILALLVQAALGLQVNHKPDESFGLEQGLDGIPQKLAKIFALAASGKVSNEGMDKELQEVFDKTHSLPKDKKTKLAKAVADMFPDDAVDLQEVVDMKYTPAAQSFLQTMEQEPRITIGGYRSKNGDPLTKDNWNAWYDDWKERGVHKPDMRGPWDYKSDTTLAKNLRLSEETFAKDNCIPDNMAMCFTKDITFLPCRTFNNCMATFNNLASKTGLYVDSAPKIGAMFTGLGAAAGTYQLGAGVCSAAKAATLPMMLSTDKGLNEVGLGTPAKPDATPGVYEGFVSAEDRLPCSVGGRQHHRQ